MPTKHTGEERKKYLATRTVHWPSGPVAVCDKHAAALVALANMLGSHVAQTYLEEEQECSNCVAEAKQPE